MDLTQRTADILEKYGIAPNVLHEQHFLIDGAVFKKIIATAQLEKKDSVVEIGTGLGILTQELAKKVQSVVTIEVDDELRKALEDLPKNVTLRWGNALEILPTVKEYTKIVANIPYQICEPLFHILCKQRHLEKAVLLVPKKFAVHVAEHPIFSAFLDVTIVEDVPKEAFMPKPKVMSAVIAVIPRKMVDDSAFIRRKLYLQRDKHLLNGLRDTLIDFYEWKGKKLTKKEALALMGSFDISEKMLEMTIARIPLEMYGKIVEKIMPLGQ